MDLLQHSTLVAPSGGLRKKTPIIMHGLYTGKKKSLRSAATWAMEP